MEYDEENEPTTFRLIFSNCIEVLQAETPDEASDWVEKIVEGEDHQNHKKRNLTMDKNSHVVIFFSM